VDSSERRPRGWESREDDLRALAPRRLPPSLPAIALAAAVAAFIARLATP
jgi:hypothetical protein